MAIRPMLSLLLALPAVALAAPGPEPPRAPETRVGPYRILVERVTGQEYLQSLFLKDPGIPPPGAAPGTPERTGKRSVNVALRLATDTPEAALALDLFSVDSVVVTANGREVEVAHYGGPLENKGDVVLRAYLYASSIGLEASEIRRVEGELAAYEHAQVITAEIPLAMLPARAELQGVRLLVDRCATRGGTTNVHLRATPPAGAQVVPVSGDGTCGILLYGDGSARAEPDGATLGATPTGEADFSLNYQALRGAPARLHVELLVRSGRRRVYPFRVEHIPLPVRPQ